MYIYLLLEIKPRTNAYFPNQEDNYYIYSLMYNNIGSSGAQALAEGLQHCTNLKELL
jgi:hypothetical protein